MCLKILCLAPLAFLALVSTAAAANIGGRYRVVGTNLDGSKYAGTADIAIGSETNCTIVWNTGGQALSGVCMRAPDSFVAAFGAANNGAGLVVYRILPDGTLNGVWTMPGQRGAGTDILTPERFASPAPQSGAPQNDAPITSDPPSHGRYDSGVPDYTHERVQ